MGEPADEWDVVGFGGICLCPPVADEATARGAYDTIVAAKAKIRSHHPALSRIELRQGGVAVETSE